MKRIILLYFLLVFTSAFASMASDETPVMFTDFLGDLDTKNAVNWQPPKYEGQKAVGYEVGAFSVPTGMEERVSFWLDIYTKYTTNEGVLHDSRYVNLVYETVDFSDIMKDVTLTRHQKQRHRSKRVKEAKKKIKQRLARLQKHTSSAGLEGEDLRYWTMFSKINEHSKFLNARHRNRLRFQLGQKDRFVKGIFYSGRYLSQIEEIFKKHNLPLELTRLPFVESSFNTKAQSSVGASGIWQFMKYTAKPYLKMNASVDERNDPIKSTEASAKLLAHYYKVLGSWPLAVTGYNHGAYGVRRLVKKYRTDNLVELIDVRHGRFGFASANFYASFLAALEAEKNAKKYYDKKILWDQPLVGEELKLTKNISLKTLVGFFDDDTEKAKQLNLHLSRSVWKKQVAIGKGNFIRVPKSKKVAAMELIKKIKNVNLYNGNVYRVRRGDTLSGIAEKHGVRLRKIMATNKHIKPRRLQVGQKIFIPK